MQSALSRELGLDLSLFAFTIQPEVVAAVTNAGGMGVLGALRYTADELAEALDYIDSQVGGKPYGVDIVMPASSLSDDKAGEFEPEQLEAQLRGMIPEDHLAFVERLLAEYDVEPVDDDEAASRLLLGWTDTTARPQVEVALSHPAALLVNALGPPPQDIVDQAHDHGMRVAALVGRADQAIKQRERGVDIVVAVGTEAGGHTGEIATMVLVPEVVEAVGTDTPVLAAGGIGRGRQIAAAEALGAQGAWTGSIWLDTVEHGHAQPGIREKLHAATSSDTIRTRALTGKPARLLRTAWTDAWEDPANPDPLGMPLQYMLNAEAMQRIHASSSPKARELLGTPVGQIVGAMNETRGVADVVEELRREYEETVARMGRGVPVSS
jgi:NAD(P)H-dependent flavin oxidoreductase YrpB (nitropropane dioxygenase family)